LKIVLKKSPGPTCQSQAPLQWRLDTGVLAPTLPTGRHVRSMHDACSCHPVHHPVTLSVESLSFYVLDSVLKHVSRVESPNEVFTSRVR
jgi:hypothetical protein